MSNYPNAVKIPSILDYQGGATYERIEGNDCLHYVMSSEWDCCLECREYGCQQRAIKLGLRKEPS